MQHDIEYIESVHKEHIHNHGPLQTFQSKEEDIWVLESHWKQSSLLLETLIPLSKTLKD